MLLSPPHCNTSGMHRKKHLFSSLDSHCNCCVLKFERNFDCVKWRFSTRTYLAGSGDIFGCPIWWWGMLQTSTCTEKTPELLNTPQCTRQLPTTKTYPDQNVTSTEVGKSRCRGCTDQHNSILMT
jgi:hypothetical protein